MTTKTPPLKFLHISCPIYSSHCDIVIGDRIKFVRYLKKTYDVTFTNDFEGLGGSCISLTKKNDSKKIIWVEFPSVNILSHELVHFCFTEFQDMKIEISKENDEPMAYFYSYMLAQLFQKLIDSNIRIDNYYVKD